LEMLKRKSWPALLGSPSLVSRTQFAVDRIEMILYGVKLLVPCTMPGETVEFFPCGGIPEAISSFLEGGALKVMRPPPSTGSSQRGVALQLYLDLLPAYPENSLQLQLRFQQATFDMPSTQEFYISVDLTCHAAASGRNLC